MANYLVGLTGGIASGKTAVSNLFAAHDIDVIDADVISREVVLPGSAALAQISERHGADILLDNNSLNRAKLRKIIFANDDERHWLESLLHPLIQTSIQEQVAQADSRYALLVSPLLLETQQHQRCDRILLIDVPVSIQIDRAVKRDQNNEDQIRRIIATQMAREERKKRADDIIDNSGALKDLEGHVTRLHQQYLNFSEKKDV